MWFAFTLIVFLCYELDDPVKSLQWKFHPSVFSFGLLEIKSAVLNDHQVPIRSVFCFLFKKEKTELVDGISLLANGDTKGCDATRLNKIITYAQGQLSSMAQEDSSVGCDFQYLQKIKRFA